MKPWAYLAIIVTILAAFGATYAKAYSSGYNSRDQEVQQDIIDAQESARQDEEAKWKATVAATEAQIVIEERIVETIREVEIEIPTVVEKIITLTPECVDLGPDYARLLNDQVRAANRIQSPEASP